MTTTTFKSVSGGNKPAAATKAPAKPVKAKPAKAKAARPVKKAAEPQPGLIMVVIAGAGTMPLHDNDGRRVMRGEPVEVSEAEVAWLAASGSEFKRV